MLNFCLTGSSPQVGFLRFLDLLATFDWKNNPLIVNLNAGLTGEQAAMQESHSVRVLSPFWSAPGSRRYMEASQLLPGARRFSTP